ncbi:hypothetical protein RUM43_008735 [Polyplax serrata]|uniref:Uncharacterized protein n=1 Tax=Polyplax serrata TaxID=468196 RepID=A0AAN8P6B8_POLSC
MNASGTPRGKREREEDCDGRKRLKKTCQENKGLLSPKHPDGMEYPPEDGDAGEEEEEEVILSIDLVHTSRLIYYGNDIADEGTSRTRSLATKSVSLNFSFCLPV